MEPQSVTPYIIEIPRVCDPRGNLSFLQRPGCMPFDVKRVYYLYDVPCDSERGGHSHRRLQQVLIAITGAFDVNVDDGTKVTTYHLNRPYQGLYLPSGMWRTLDNFTSGAVCVVLASEIYDEEEYVRDYDEFKSLSKARRTETKPENKKKHYPFLDLGLVNQPYKQALKDAACRVIENGCYIGGPEVEGFEKEIAQLCQVPHAIGVSNGLDALRLILRGYIELGRLRYGDEVIVPGDTFVASVLAISDNGLVPVFADVDINTKNLDAEAVRRVVTPRTRAIMPVHLYGRVSWNEELGKIVKENQLLVIEDNAQAIGAKSPIPGLFGTSMTGGLGHAAGMSFYPTKNLGALGDGGIITTHDAELARVVTALRNYGSDRQYHNKYAGLNCRLDPIQAAMMRVKLPYLARDNKHRQAIAKIYNDEIKNAAVLLPSYGGDDCVWHQYVVLVEDRDGFRKYLLDNGVETGVHYPRAPFDQPCYEEYAEADCPNATRICAECVSLPINSSMTEDDAHEIAAIVNSYATR
ncbi:MAG: DegT/DnrJ/EryC1/StrS family aminotransferase [Bacteroidales bacterium]|nr:DegT/DnrJ/EryC1/StrS family aminotransferase [Bacteroidales bacterium]